MGNAFLSLLLHIIRRIKEKFERNSEISSQSTDNKKDVYSDKVESERAFKAEFGMKPESKI